MSSDSSSELTVDEKLERIGDKWGVAYMAFYPHYDEDHVILRNKTDEGLGAKGERREFSGDSFTDVVDKAYESVDD